MHARIFRHLLRRGILHHRCRVRPGRNQDRRHAAADRRLRRLGQLRRRGREDRRGYDQRGRRRARPEDPAGHRGQQVQPDRGGGDCGKADLERQGAGDDGRLEFDADARGDAQADGIRRADGGGNLLLGQDHRLRQFLDLPHQPDLRDGGEGLHRLRQDARHQEGGFPRHQQRLRPRRLEGILRDAEGPGRADRRHGDHGPEGDRFFGAARQDQGLRRRHAIRHDRGGADHADPQTGEGTAAQSAHHHHRRLQFARPADPAGGRRGQRLAAPRFLHAVVPGCGEEPGRREEIRRRMECAQASGWRPHRGLPRLGRHPHHRRGDQGGRQGRAGGDPEGAVGREGEGHQRRHRLHQAGSRRPGERAERAERLHGEDRRRQGRQELGNPLRGPRRSLAILRSPRGFSFLSHDLGPVSPARPERVHAGRHLCAARHRAHAHLRHHARRQFHARRAVRVRRLHDVHAGDADGHRFLRRAGARDRAGRGAGRRHRSRAAAAAARRRHRHHDARHDRRLDRAAERRAARLDRRGQIPQQPVSRGAARDRPGVGGLEPRVRVWRRARPDRRDLRAYQPHAPRQGDARDLSRPRYRCADGHPDRQHPHRDVCARLGPCRRRGRIAGTGLRRLSQHGRPRRGEGLRDRDPRRPRQHPRRDRGRLHPRAGRRAGRGLYLLGLPRRDGIPAHHRDSAFPTDRALRAERADRVKAALTWAWLIALATLPLWLDNPYVLHVLIVAGIFIVAAMSLNLLLGYTGQLSLGHVAFFGIGAYASALASLGFSIHILPDFVLQSEAKPVWLGMLAGIAVAGACGWLIGRLAFKVRGAYFVIVSISFAEVVRLVALNWVELTQGPMALNNIPPLTLWLPGAGETTFWKKPANYWLVLATAALCYVLIRRLVRSRAGRAMVALRENEPLATSVGVVVTRTLVLTTVVSAAMAGSAGALYAHYVRIVDPDVFLFIYTVTMVIMVVTGGKGTLAGPVVGGLIFGLLPEGVRALDFKPEMQWIVYGVLMILVVYFLPQGIVPALEAWWRRR